MIRFLVNFVLFGIFFFCLWKFFPDFFATLVSWANQLVELVQQYVKTASEHIHKKT